MQTTTMIFDKVMYFVSLLEYFDDMAIIRIMIGKPVILYYKFKEDKT